MLEMLYIRESGYSIYIYIYSVCEFKADLIPFNPFATLDLHVHDYVCVSKRESMCICFVENSQFDVITDILLLNQNGNFIRQTHAHTHTKAQYMSHL